MTVALALAERYAPRLGARLAVRMWITLPPGAPAAGRPALAEPGERASVHVDGRGPGRVDGRGPGRVFERRSGRRNGRGLGSVVTESWGGGPLVYLLHGWGGYRGQLGAFVWPRPGSGSSRWTRPATASRGREGTGRGAA